MKKILLILYLTFVGCLMNPGSPASQERPRLSIQAVVRLKIARVYLHAGELERTLILINHALSIHPGYAEAFHVRGIVHYRKELLKEACGN